MSSLSEQKIYRRQRELQSEGWEWETQNFHAVNPHSGHETLRHYLVKCAIANQIANEGGRFVTEAKHPVRGQADIIDLKPADPKAVVIEVETGATRGDIVAKADQYAGDMIRDVAVIDPLQVPESVDEWDEWIAGKRL